MLTLASAVRGRSMSVMVKILSILGSAFCLAAAGLAVLLEPAVAAGYRAADYWLMENSKAYRTVMERTPDPFKNLAIANAGGPGPEYNSAIPSDSVLLKWMGQPVEQTLAGMNVTRVNDSNYQREVYGSNRPVMVLFYNNRGRSSAGNATLLRAISQRFSQIKICAYKISDGSETETYLLNHLRRTYGLKKTPAMLLYKYENGGIKNMGDDWHLHGGIKRLDFLKKKIVDYFKYIPQGML